MNKEEKILCGVYKITSLKECIYVGQSVDIERSKAMTGRIPLQKTRDKISESLTGKMAGKNHPQYGKPRKQKTRDKISKTLSGKSNPMYGKTWEEIFGTEKAKKLKQDLAKRGKERIGKKFPNGYKKKELIKVV